MALRAQRRDGVETFQRVKGICAGRGNVRYAEFPLRAGVNRRVAQDLRLARLGECFPRAKGV